MGTVTAATSPFSMASMNFPHTHIRPHLGRSLLAGVLLLICEAQLRSQLHSHVGCRAHQLRAQLAVGLKSDANPKAPALAVW